jgi:hypothetical protein
MSAVVFARLALFADITLFPLLRSRSIRSRYPPDGGEAIPRTRAPLGCLFLRQLGHARALVDLVEPDRRACDSARCPDAPQVVPSRVEERGL